MRESQIWSLGKLLGIEADLFRMAGVRRGGAGGVFFIAVLLKGNLSWSVHEQIIAFIPQCFSNTPLPPKNIARGTTDPGYRIYNLSYLSSKMECHLHWFQIWPIVCCSTCISSKSDHQVLPPKLVPILATRRRYLHQLQVYIVYCYNLFRVSPLQV